MIIVTIFGNILIIVSIYKYPKQFKGSLYMLIGNLAAADLLLGVWLLVFLLEKMIPDMKENWHYCVVKPIGIFIPYGCSIMCLLGISFDRFMAVLFPLKHLLKTNRRKLFIVYLAGMWLIAILAGGLPIIFQNLKPPNSTFICNVGTIIPQEFELIPPILIIVTGIIDFILFGAVIWKIKTNKVPGNSVTRKKNTKTILMIIVLVLFVICWMPFIICSLMMQADISISTLQNIICAKEYLAKLGLGNSAMNWILYGLANKKFRIAFRTLLCYSGCCTSIQQALSKNVVKKHNENFDGLAETEVANKKTGQ
jgi:hypothetical protein